MPRIASATEFGRKGQAIATRLARMERDAWDSVVHFRNRIRTEGVNPVLANNLAVSTHTHAELLRDLGEIMAGEGDLFEGDLAAIGESVYGLDLMGQAVYVGRVECPSDDGDDITREDEIREWAAHYADGIACG